MILIKWKSKVYRTDEGGEETVSDNVTESVNGMEKHKGDITTRPTTSPDEEALASVEKRKKVSGRGRGRERPRGRVINKMFNVFL